MTKTNKLPRHNMWITLKLAEIRAAIKKNKVHAKDNIERSEPDTIIMNAQDWVFGGLISAMWMMIAYAFMTNQIDTWIVTMLQLIDGPFEIRFATLTSVFVLFSDMLVILGIAISHEPSTGDIVDVVNDQSDQLDERFAELEDRLDERLAAIQKELN